MTPTKALPVSQFSQAIKIVSNEQKQLINDVQTILDRLQQDHINDYSFLVAPMAKAYEGYLKDFFLEINLIDDSTYRNDRFRVGKTLNPSLRYKRFSIFRQLAEIDDKGEELAEILWDAWKKGRNETLHYFPHNLKKLNKDEALERISQMINAIILADKFIRENLQPWPKSQIKR